MTKAQRTVKALMLVLGLAIVGSSMLTGSVKARGAYCEDTAESCHATINNVVYHLKLLI